MYQQQRGVSVFVRALLCVLAGIVVLEAGPVRAQDLDAGKSGQRLYATNCSSCHRSPRSLAKHTNAWTLAYFLRQHYTASSQQASVLTNYLLSVNSVSSRDGQKAGGPQQSLLSWLGWPFDSGQKQPKATKRSKAAPKQSAAPARSVSDAPNR
jgi:hypothetical protein